jgi:CheY-like chemotaxis protein
MEIMIAEDEEYAALAYKVALERKGHSVKIVNNGEDCVKDYHEQFVKTRTTEAGTGTVQEIYKLHEPTVFDAVVLDYRMPRKDGMAAAKEILEINPKQRIIFASAYVKDTLVDSVKQLNRVVELLQKPFEVEHLVETIEDKEIYRGLEMLNVDVKALKGMDPTHEQIRSLLEGLRKLQTVKTF